MLEKVQKVGSKYLVHVEILKAFRDELEKLPKKEKILYDFKSAIASLRPFLELAIEKNYTKDEIFDLMGKVGWKMNRNTFKHFWNIYLLEEENSGKKKKRSKKSKNETSCSKSKNNLSHAFSDDDDNESKNKIEKSSANSGTQEDDEKKADEKKNFEVPKSSFLNMWRTSGAHFDVKPDMKDL